MAFVAHLYGEDVLPAHWQNLHSAETDWSEIEGELSQHFRVFARAAYLRSLILNGGIAVPTSSSLLVSSIPEFARDPQLASPKDLLPFMIVRAAYQTAHAGMLVEAMQIILLGTRYLPLRLYREAFLSLASRMLANTRRAEKSYDSQLKSGSAREGMG